MERNLDRQTDRERENYENLRKLIMASTFSYLSTILSTVAAHPEQLYYQNSSSGGPLFDKPSVSILNNKNDSVLGRIEDLLVASSKRIYELQRPERGFIRTATTRRNFKRRRKRRTINSKASLSVIDTNDNGDNRYTPMLQQDNQGNLQQVPREEADFRETTLFQQQKFYPQGKLYQPMATSQHKNKKPVYVAINQQTVNGLLSLLLLFIISICGSIGTIFVISSLTVVESLQIRGNCYLVSLALAHLLINLLVIPSSALQIMAGDNGLNPAFICHNQWLMLEFSLIVSQLTFFSISLDNYLSFKFSEKIETIKSIDSDMNVIKKLFAESNLPISANEQNAIYNPTAHKMPSTNNLATTKAPVRANNRDCCNWIRRGLGARFLFWSNPRPSAIDQSKYRLSNQFNELNCDYKLSQSGCLGYKYCCGRFKVILWIILIWLIALYYTIYQNEFSYGVKFCSTPTGGLGAIKQTLNSRAPISVNPQKPQLSLKQTSFQGPSFHDESLLESRHKRHAETGGNIQSNYFPVGGQPNKRSYPLNDGISQDVFSNAHDEKNDDRKRIDRGAEMRPPKTTLGWPTTIELNGNEAGDGGASKASRVVKHDGFGGNGSSLGKGIFLNDGRRELRSAHEGEERNNYPSVGLASAQPAKNDKIRAELRPMGSVAYGAIVAGIARTSSDQDRRQQQRARLTNQSIDDKVSMADPPDSCHRNVDRAALGAADEPSLKENKKFYATTIITSLQLESGTGLMSNDKRAAKKIKPFAQTPEHPYQVESQTLLRQVRGAEGPTFDMQTNQAALGSSASGQLIENGSINFKTRPLAPRFMNNFGQSTPTIRASSAEYFTTLAANLSATGKQKSSNDSDSPDLAAHIEPAGEPESSYSQPNQLLMLMIQSSSSGGGNGIEPNNPQLNYFNSVASNEQQQRARRKPKLYWFMLLSCIILPTLASAILFAGAYLKMKEFKLRQLKPMPMIMSHLISEHNGGDKSSAPPANSVSLKLIAGSPEQQHHHHQCNTSGLDYPDSTNKLAMVAQVGRATSGLVAAQADVSGSSSFHLLPAPVNPYQGRRAASQPNQTSYELSEPGVASFEGLTAKLKSRRLQLSQTSSAPMGQPSTAANGGQPILQQRDNYEHLANSNYIGALVSPMMLNSMNSYPMAAPTSRTAAQTSLHEQYLKLAGDERVRTVNILGGPQQQQQQMETRPATNGGLQRDASFSAPPSASFRQPRPFAFSGEAEQPSWPDESHLGGQEVAGKIQLEASEFINQQRRQPQQLSPDVATPKTAPSLTGDANFSSERQYEFKRRQIHAQSFHCGSQQQRQFSHHQLHRGRQHRPSDWDSLKQIVLADGGESNYCAIKAAKEEPTDQVDRGASEAVQSNYLHGCAQEQRSLLARHQSLPHRIQRQTDRGHKLNSLKQLDEALANVVRSSVEEPSQEEASDEEFVGNTSLRSSANSNQTPEVAYQAAGKQAAAPRVPNKAVLYAYSYMIDDQLLKSNMIVFVLNSLLWFPFVLLTILLNVDSQQQPREGAHVTQELKDAVWWLAILNCCSCSYVYAITNKDFREAFNKLFYYCCCKSHVTFQRKTAIFRRQIDLEQASGNLAIHIIPGLNLYSNKLSKSSTGTTCDPHLPLLYASASSQQHHHHHLPNAALGALQVQPGSSGKCSRFGLHPAAHNANRHHHLSSSSTGAGNANSKLLNPRHSTAAASLARMKQARASAGVIGRQLARASQL